MERHEDPKRHNDNDAHRARSFLFYPPSPSLMKSTGTCFVILEPFINPMNSTPTDGSQMTHKIFSQTQAISYSASVNGALSEFSNPFFDASSSAHYHSHYHK
jgi:hypothetical protein